MARKCQNIRPKMSRASGQEGPPILRPRLVIGGIGANPRDAVLPDSCPLDARPGAAYKNRLRTVPQGWGGKRID